jgi:hypothetical protein
MSSLSLSLSHTHTHTHARTHTRTHTQPPPSPLPPPHTGSKDTTVAQPLTSTKGEPIKPTQPLQPTQPMEAGKEEEVGGGGVAHKLKGMLSNLFGGGAKLDKQTLAALGSFLSFFFFKQTLALRWGL